MSTPHKLPPPSTLSDYSTLDVDRRQKPVRMKYNPEISLGNLFTAGTLAVTMIVAYGTYTRDQEKRDSKIAILEKNQDEDKKSVKESLAKVESSIDKIQASLTTLDKNVAIINAKTGNSK
jgi:hypothetical protein